MLVSRRVFLDGPWLQGPADGGTSCPCGSELPKLLCSSVKTSLWQSSRCCPVLCRGRTARAPLREPGWIWGQRSGRNHPGRAASPLAFAAMDFASSLEDPLAFRCGAQEQMPPALSQRGNSCGPAPVCPDNSWLLGGFRCLPSYKMFVNRIYAGSSVLAEHQQAAGLDGRGGGSEAGASPFAWERGAAVPPEPHPPRRGHGRVQAGSQTFLGDCT